MTATETLIILDELNGNATGTADRPVSRRQVLRLGAGGLAVAAGAGLLPGLGRRVEAGPAVFLAKVATAAAVGWFVERLFDHWFLGQYEQRATLAEKPAPPTRGQDRFHDSHASPLTLQDYEVSRRLVCSNRVDVSISRHLYATCHWGRRSSCLTRYDINNVEAVTIHQTWKSASWSGIPLPAGPRTKPNCRAQALMERELSAYSGVDARQWQVDCVRRFQAPEWSAERTGMQISQRSNPASKSLVIVQT